MKNFLIFICMVCVYLIPFFGCMDGQFFIDEGDNIIGGMVVAHGGEIYKNFYSQHTPLMYYLMAVFKLLGALDVYLYRMYFYILLSIGYAGIFFRYQKIAGKFSLFFFPLLYYFSFSLNPTVSHAILSEHIQSICYAILFLELYAISIANKVTKIGLAISSVACFIAVGVAFLSIYFVAAYFFAVLCLRCLQISREQNFSVLPLRNFIVEIFRLLFYFSVPYLLFFLWYWIYNNLDNIYYQSYLFNREVYSRYLSGFWQSKLDPIIDSLKFYKEMISVNSNVDYKNIRLLLNPIFNILFVLILFFKNRLAAFFAIVLILTTLVRGYSGFHSLPYWSVSALMITFSINYFIFMKPFKNKLIGRWISLASIVVIPFLISFIAINDSFKGVMKSLGYSKKAESYKEISFNKEAIVSSLLNPNESFFQTSLDNEIYIKTHKVPALPLYGLVPWFSEIYEKEIIEKLDALKIKIIFHNPNHQVWGHILHEYAPSLNNYILSNYVRLNGNFSLNADDNVYVRKEFFNDAIRLMKIKFPLVFDTYVGLSLKNENELLDGVGEIYGSNIVKQSFKSEHDFLSQVHIFFTTYARKNNGILEFKLMDNDGHLLAHEKIKISSILDNDFFKFAFTPISNSKSKTYVIMLESMSASNGNAVSVVTSGKKTYADGMFSFSGRFMDGDIVMKLLYKRTQ